jgi:predicted amidohydrolase YtcJ
MRIFTLALLLILNACRDADPPPAHPPQAAESQPADTSTVVTVVHNARIVTVDEQNPSATAMAIDADGRIRAIGDDSAVLAAHPGGTAVDMNGRVILPGLIDALQNLAMVLSRINLVGTRSKQEVLERLSQYERKLDADDWLIGRGWDQNDWPEKVFPSRRDLDALFPQRPVLLERVDGHAYWANSSALAQADRDFSGEWQPEGGLIHRDSGGQATGILVDRAMAFLDAEVPAYSEGYHDRALDLALDHIVQNGLTGLHDAGVDRKTAERYIRRIETRRFPLRLYAMAGGTGDVTDWICARPIHHPSGRFEMRSVKLYADGALGSRGAALLEDYSDEPFNQGLLIDDPSTLARQIKRVLECGLQAGVHAIGDRANQVILDAFEEQLPKFPDNPGRHRIEHVQVLTARDLPRLAQLDVIASMQPTHATSDMYWAQDRVGADRIQFSYAWQKLLKSGARLALGSDFPVEEVNPFHGIYAAVSRQDLAGQPEGGWYAGERLSRQQALHGFTLGAAHAAFMENEVGSLVPGKRADFIVIDRDIMTVPARSIADTQVLETWLDGELVFSRQGSESNSRQR